MINPAEIRRLIDEYFSLAWCRENVVIPLGISRENGFLPVDSTAGSLVVAIGNLSFLGTIGEFIKHRVSRSSLVCQFVERPHEEIQSLIEQASEQRLLAKDAIDNSVDAFIQAIRQEDRQGLESPLGELEFEDERDEFICDDQIPDLSSELLGSPIQKASAQLLLAALNADATCILIEPQESDHRIRLRQDGALRPYVRVPISAGIKLMACLKNMAGMNVAERRSSQEGRIQRKMAGKRLVCHMTTCLGRFGETSVIRLLVTSGEFLCLDRIISNDDVRSALRKPIQKLHGLIVVAGQIDVGKTTTLYAALREIDSDEKSIVTVEYPIEFTLPGITQIQASVGGDQDFAAILKTVLRADPDVVMTEEVRGKETMAILTEAASQGRLVLAGIHARNAVAALSRIASMGLSKHLLVELNGAVLSQRLVRKICNACSIERPCLEEDALLTGLLLGSPLSVASSLSAAEKAIQSRDGTLCPNCQGIGYKGRVGVYEIVSLTREVIFFLMRASQSPECYHDLADSIFPDGINMLGACSELVRDRITSVAEYSRLKRSMVPWPPDL